MPRGIVLSSEEQRHQRPRAHCLQAQEARLAGGRPSSECTSSPPVAWRDGGRRRDRGERRPRAPYGPVVAGNGWSSFGIPERQADVSGRTRPPALVTRSSSWARLSPELPGSVGKGHPHTSRIRSNRPAGDGASRRNACRRRRTDKHWSASFRWKRRRTGDR